MPKINNETKNKDMAKQTPMSTDNANNISNKMKNIEKPITSITEKVKNLPIQNNVEEVTNKSNKNPGTNNEVTLETDKEIKYGAGAGVVASFAINNKHKKTPEIPEDFDSQQIQNKKELNKEFTSYKQQCNDNPDDSNSNFKPSLIKLKTINNKEYTTNINENTKAENLSDLETLEEMENRQTLIKQKSLKDGQFKKQEIILEDGDTYNLNTSKYNAKLTPQGAAYLKKIQDHDNNVENIPSISINENSEDKFVIIVPPQPADDLLVETGKQSHLLVGATMSDGNVAVIGYFTSKKTATLISEKQYKNFQDEHESNNNETSINKGKQQYFVEFDHIQIIEKDNVKVVKYSQEYLHNISEKTKDLLQEIFKEQKQQTVQFYDNHGVTRPMGLQICKEYDKVAQAKLNDPKSKLQHPLTDEQKKLNKENQEYQKQFIKTKKYDNNDDNENQKIL